MRHATKWSAMFVIVGLLWPAHHVAAQGVTTGTITGVVADVQKQPVAGAAVIAIHLPSGTTYEATTRNDGRFSIPNMRVGGPYTITVAHGGTGAAFEPTTQENVEVNLGVASDVVFEVKPISVEVMITVTAQSDTVFNSARTGAATSVTRTEIATLPTIAGRLNDVTRLTPQASGNNFAGQGDRGNNITVDGSYFNNSFGISGTPGERTGVAPISLEAIEQIQVNVAPFDVRQGAFVGAGVNMVTRSGTNNYNAAFYHRLRNQDWVGTKAKGLEVNPGTFEFRNTGGWGGGPIIKNRWFAFGNYEDEKDQRPLVTFRANNGNEPVGGSTTRVLASELTDLSSFLSSRLGYDTGTFSDIPDETPAKRFILRSDYNIKNSNRVTFRYSVLDSLTDAAMSTSSALGFGRSSSTNFLSYQNSNYQILENIRSGIAEWNAVIGNSMANQVIGGYTTQDESRKTRYGGDVFPFVDILDGSGVTYTSFGFEPFTPFNELRYHTFQLQDNFTKFGNRHSLTFGASTEKYHSYNSFYPGVQSAYVYNTLNEFFTDANDFVANPNRTTSPVTLRRFQVRYSNIPGVVNPPQPLDVWYSGAYVQDEWRPSNEVTVTAGVRADVSMFGDTAYSNPNADALTFLDENGAAVQYQSGNLPDPKVLWSPRFGVNWDVSGTRNTQIRGGTGLFSGRPAYVWISNQIGNTGVLSGFLSVDNTTAFPFNSDPAKYKPVLTTQGPPATSYELNATDPDFKFPQVWRSNIALDQRLPWGITSSTEIIYNRDINGMYYINANLPLPQSAFAGADTRPRWVGTACSANGNVGGCVTRINANPGNVVTNAFVLKNQNFGRSWVFSESLSKTLRSGFAIRGAYSYGESKNTVDPGSTASGNFNSVLHHGNPNNPGLGFSSASPGHRVYALVSYSRVYLEHLTTSISAFWEGRTFGNTSYTFAGDMNGDSVSGNDLIYIPRNTSEMNFAPFTVGAVTFTAEQQAATFDAYIQQDKYLRKHRGEYAERGAVFLPMVKRLDLSISQDVFHNIRGKRNSGQIRLDFTNFGNLLNSNWGVAQRVTQNQILTNPGVDGQGRANYRLAVFNNALVNRTFQTTTSLNDVYQFLVSFRYGFGN